MNFKSQWKPLAWMTVIFAVLYTMPIENVRLQNAILESFKLVKWYAREHVILCLLPAFFIAGGISVFLNQDTVMRYLGAGAPKGPAYAVASISGTILAVCSCTVLPLFAGIFTMGAGLGPATAFLYSGPAINVLAIVLTARVLGPELGTARGIGAIVFSILIGLAMAWLFRSEARKTAPTPTLPTHTARPLIQTVIFFGLMVAILVFANWGRPAETTGIWSLIYNSKWIVTSILSVALFIVLTRWYGIRPWKLTLTGILVALLAWIFPGNAELPFLAGIAGLSLSLGTTKGEMSEWLDASWTFAKQILPLLVAGVFIAGLALGSPEADGLVPSTWIASMVGDNSMASNLFASISGAFMYFATLTEVPILEGLLGNGMHRGPALALLLAGPALSLPNMLVIRSIMGTRKTLAFILLVIVMSTIAGLLYGWLI